MNSNAIRLVAIVLGLLAVILAIVGWQMSRSFAESANRAQSQTAVEQAQAVPQILVVIATKPLAANVPITSDAVVLAPVTIAPTEYFANVEDAVGRTPLIDIDAGAPVTPRFFKDANLIARGVPDGHRAISVRVDDVVGVGGFIRPGDIVDVLLFVRAAGDTLTGQQQKKTEDIPAQARVLIRDIRVLAYEEHLVEPPKGIDENDKSKQDKRRPERTAVLAIPEPMVTKVMLGASYGDLRLSLHGTPPPDAIAATPDAAAAASATDPGISALPVAAEVKAPVLSAEAKAKAELEARRAAESIITATELTELIPKERTVRRLPASVAPQPRVEIYRGTKLETVAQ